MPQGLPDFAGEGRYRAAPVIPPDALGKPLELDLGDLANAAEVRLNGEVVGRRVGPPWRFVLPAPTQARLDLEVRVINTPENLFGVEPRPSGLFDPVSIRW